MADDGASAAGGSTARDGSDGPEPATIEINIKTLESQVHKLRVDKNETVLNLKEKIVDVAGIPVEQQRLIFRGRVLKDDHLLSEYHLEDGYTLHLVARRTAEGQQSSETSEASPNPNVNNAGNGAMLGDYMSRETIDVMVSEGVINDIPATVRDILGNFLGMPGGMANATFSVPPDGANNGRTQPGQAPPGFSILNHQIHVTQLPPSGAIPRNLVIPDSMTTLLEYIDRMDQVLQNNGIPPSMDSNAQEPPTSTSDDAYLNQRFPSPEVLASVVERAQQLLGGSASSALSHLAQRIQSDAATGDASVRSQIQNESAQLGVAIQHLGAMLFELGRTMMTLRMGPSPANAFVNAGPAVYITPTGPSPIMVQPSFQSAPHFGVSSIPPVFGVSGPFGIVDPSRANGVNVHGGASATSGPSVGSTTASATAANGESQNAERTQGGNPSATRGLPPRTVVAAIPGFPGRSSVGVILPVQMRSQVAAPNQSTGPQGSQTAVGNGSQPISTYVVPQASTGSAISSMIAQISAQVANALAANPQALASLTSSVLNPAAQGPHPTTNNGAGTVSSVTSGNTQLQNELPGSHHGQTSLNVQSHATGAGTVPSNTSDPSLTPQDISTVSASDVDSSQQHSVELAAASLGGQLTAASLGEQPTGTRTGDVPLGMPAENTELKSKPSDGEAGESTKPTASGGSGPLGLGGGLQPKRRSKVAKPSGTSSNSGEAVNTSSAPRSQEAVLMGQQALQALVSRGANASSGSVTTSQAPSSTPRSAAGMTMRRPGGEGQVDIGSMISSVLNSPVFGSLMSNVAGQPGMESSADVRNIMEDLTQNRAVMDTLIPTRTQISPPPSSPGRRREEQRREREREGEIMVAPNVKAETMRLMDRRSALEAEMDAIIAALSAPGGAGITGSLVDAEGFPRADIDIPAALAQRRKLGELRNDHKDVTNKIEKNLEVLHSTKLTRNEQSIPRSSGISAPPHGGLSRNDPMEEDLVTRLPFAMIDDIADGSPAALDGLLLGDEIVKFGSVEAGGRLQERLVSEALSNEDNQVSLLIIRQGSPMNLTITPRKWHGRGLMGCHFRIL